MKYFTTKSPMAILEVLLQSYIHGEDEFSISLWKESKAGTNQDEFNLSKVFSKNPWVAVHSCGYCGV